MHRGPSHVVNLPEVSLASRVAAVFAAFVRLRSSFSPSSSSPLSFVRAGVTFESVCLDVCWWQGGGPTR